MLMMMMIVGATIAFSSDRVETILSKMTLEQKVGQMLQLDILKFLNPGTLGA